MKIPFAIERMFYICGSDATVIRGRHANRRSEFVLINVAGTSKVKVRDGRGREKIYNLDRPRIGLYLPPMVWKDMYDFSPDSMAVNSHYRIASREGALRVECGDKRLQVVEALALQVRAVLAGRFQEASGGFERGTGTLGL